MASDRGGSTHPSDITFRSETKDNPEARGGSTHPAKGEVGTGSLVNPDNAAGRGRATNPVSPTGKPEGDRGPN